MTKILSVKKLGEQKVCDITVDQYHNYIANGVVVHNCQQVATQLAGFSPLESNRLRKVLIKEKNPEVLEQLKQRFIKGAQPRVEAGELTKEDVIKMFDHLHSFAKYGFNRCLGLETVVETPDGLKLLGDIQKGQFVLDDSGSFVEVVDIYDSQQETYEITFESGKTLTASLNHKVLCDDGEMRALREVIAMDVGVMCDAEN